jgi:hypothetical protein
MSTAAALLFTIPMPTHRQVRCVMPKCKSQLNATNAAIYRVPRQPCGVAVDEAGAHLQAVHNLTLRASLRGLEAMIRPQRVPRLMRLYFRVGGTVAFGGCGSATTTRMRGDMTGGLCGT